MKTVGEILKSARKKKGIKRSKLAKKTKIDQKYINALEKNDYSNLPEAAFVKGFIKNYAQAVDLNPAQVLAVFRRDYDQNVQGKVIPRELTPSNVSRRVLWSPKTTIIASIAIVGVGLAAYFIYQYRLLIAAPDLEITSPQEQEQVTATVTVRGVTDPQATVKINNEQALVDSDGEFSLAIVLPEGTRSITVQATSRSGKSRTIQRTVQVQN